MRMTLSDEWQNYFPTNLKAIFSAVSMPSPKFICYRSKSEHYTDFKINLRLKRVTDSKAAPIDQLNLGRINTVFECIVGDG